MANVVKYILDIDAKGSVSGLKQAGDQAERFEEKAKDAKRSGLDMAAKIGSAVTGLYSGLRLATGAISTFTNALIGAGEASFNLTRSVVDSVNQLNDLSARSGIAVGSIQALIQAFEGSGQSAQQAEAFITRFPKLLADLEIGTKRATDASQKLGISIKDNEGNLKSSDQVLQEVVAGLQGVEDQTERAIVATELFGRSAAGLLQALGETAAIQDFIKFTELFGVSAAPKASKEAAQFQQLLSALGIAASGLKQKFIDAVGGVSAFNNVLLFAIKSIASLQGFIVKNQPVLESISGIVQDLAIQTFQFFQGLVGSFATWTESMIGFLDLVTPYLLEFLDAALNLSGVGALLGLDISDETKLSIQNTISQLEELSNKAKGIGVEFSKIDFVGRVSETEEAAAAEDLLSNIFSGISTSADGAVPSLEDLGEAIEGAGEAAKNAEPNFQESAVTIATPEEFANLQQRQLDPENITDTIKTMNDLIDQFGDPTQKKLDSTRESISALEAGLELYNSLNLDTFELQAALNSARNQEVDLLQQQTSATEQINSKISQYVDNFQRFIKAISSPEALTDSAEPFLKNLGTRMNEIGEEFGSASLEKLGAVIAAAAPVAGAIGGAVLAIEKLGQTTEKDLKENFTSFTKNFLNGVNLIPVLLSEILPQFIADLTVAIIASIGELAITIPVAIISSIPLLIGALVEGFKGLIDNSVKNIKEVFSAGGQFKEAFFGEDRETRKEARKSLREQILGFESGGSVAGSGVRFTGEGEGLAILHKNEFVVNASGRTSQAAAQVLEGQSGMTLNIYADIIEGSAVDELVRKIEQRVGQFGASTSNLFGGA